MVGSRTKRHLFSVLIAAAFLSVGFLFALLERYPQDIVKIQNSFPALSDAFVTDKQMITWTPANTTKDTSSENPQLQASSKRQVLLIVAHGRSGSTFLADIFNHHPRVFYVFEPLHGLIPKQKDRNYETYALNFLYRIFQCDFSAANAARHFGHFYRHYSRALSSPPFCKYEPSDPRWHFKFCFPLDEATLEHSCKSQYNTIVYKLLFDRIPGNSIEKLFGVCELSRIECKVIHLIRDIRPVVMSARKVAFFKEVDHKSKPSLRQFVYFHCEVTENNLQLAKSLDLSLRRRYVLVRYEDLAVQPLQLLDYLFEFAGLEVLESIKQWVVNTTQPNFNDLQQQARNPTSVIRNSLEVLSKWRLKADPLDMNIIERYCRDVMKMMGYIPIQGSYRLLRNLSSPLFNDTFPAQQWIKGYQKSLP